MANSSIPAVPGSNTDVAPIETQRREAGFCMRVTLAASVAANKFTAVSRVALHPVVAPGRRPLAPPPAPGQAGGPYAHILLVSLKLD